MQRPRLALPVSAGCRAAGLVGCRRHSQPSDKDKASSRPRTDTPLPRRRLAGPVLADRLQGLTPPNARYSPRGRPPAAAQLTRAPDSLGEGVLHGAMIAVGHAAALVSERGLQGARFVPVVGSTGCATCQNPEPFTHKEKVHAVIATIPSTRSRQKFALTLILIVPKNQHQS